MQPPWSSFILQTPSTLNPFHHPLQQLSGLRFIRENYATGCCYSWGDWSNGFGDDSGQGTSAFSILNLTQTLETLERYHISKDTLPPRIPKANIPNPWKCPDAQRRAVSQVKGEEDTQVTQGRKVLRLDGISS